jgi:hypothetical protein
MYEYCLSTYFTVVFVLLELDRLGFNLMKRRFRTCLGNDVLRYPMANARRRVFKREATSAAVTQHGTGKFDSELI